MQHESFEHGLGAALGVRILPQSERTVRGGSINQALNPFKLFGGGYLAQAGSMIERLLAEIS